MFVVVIPTNHAEVEPPSRIAQKYPDAGVVPAAPPGVAKLYQRSTVATDALDAFVLDLMLPHTIAPELFDDDDLVPGPLVRRPRRRRRERCGGRGGAGAGRADLAATIVVGLQHATDVGEQRRDIRGGRNTPGGPLLVQCVSSRSSGLRLPSVP